MSWGCSLPRFLPDGRTQERLEQRWGKGLRQARLWERMPARSQCSGNGNPDALGARPETRDTVEAPGTTLRGIDSLLLFKKKIFFF